ncbi:MAG: LysR family transcriptional regulator [Achromobacter pulmonis]|uniref:HTH-type transcriptional regulator GltC n=1 Tax=Achromobacter pulmonis TaxID=1389932 RepID=A0A6S7CE22_9BURK|nr:LysR family transcriptional regulator [Achromobacter pulmonis]MCF7768245.1 LysR family transcriptional regulator [Achromobacter pulmonis]MPT28615.1 LysR family transcriptional regulator [Achromobacter sp.]CAB3640359.1 HTH-type transcriptional regulator GltC [Achromobacter pulmonis]CAB3841363.1 HTH-type transcriptional regulator GltC [Achromobacter pulmonis]
MNIKYRPLKAFLLAVDSGSFSHAANQLGVTQPSFTALIQDLEDVLGLRLFERTTRSISLTSAGQDFHARVQRPIADLEEAYRSLADLAAVRRGNVTLGALPSTALALLPVAAGALRQRHPALKVRVVEAHNDELVAMLRTNQIEFAVGALAEPAPDLSFTALAEDCFCAIYPEGHRLDRKRGPLHWRDVLRYDLILLSQGSNARQQFDRAVREETGAPATALRYDVTNMGTAAGMVRQGLGVSVLPRLALPELNLAGLRAAPLCDASARRAIGLLHRRDRSLSPAAQALAAQLATAMQAISRRLLPLPPLK